MLAREPDQGSQPVRLEWTPRASDYREALYASRRVLFLSPYLGAGIGVLLVVIGVLAGAPASVGAGIGLGGAMAGYVPLQAWIAARRIAERGSQQVTVGPAGLGARTGLGTADHPWTSIGTWQETRSLFILRFGSKRHDPVIAIPKRAAPEPRDEHQVRSLLEHNLGGASPR